MIRIREGTEPDFERLRAIAVEAKAHWGYDRALVEEWAQGGDFDPESLRARLLYVAEVEGAPVGWAALIPRGEVGWLEDLWIEPAWIGQGLGRALFEPWPPRPGGAARAGWSGRPSRTRTGSTSTWAASTSATAKRRSGGACSRCWRSSSEGALAPAALRVETQRVPGAATEHPEADVILDVEFDDGLFFLVLENTGSRPATRCACASPSRSRARRREADRPAAGSSGGSSCSGRGGGSGSSSTAPRCSSRATRRPRLEARIAWRTDEGERRSRTVRHDLDAYRDFPYLEVPRDAPAPSRPVSQLQLPRRDRQRRLGRLQRGGAARGRIEVVAYREGTDKTSAARLLPGRVEYGPVVLRRGFAGDPTLFEWWNEVVQGNVARRNVSIVLLDEQRQEVARWLIRRAWPSKWTGPELRGLGNDAAIETLELSHEGIELA